LALKKKEREKERKPEHRGLKTGGRQSGPATTQRLEKSKRGGDERHQQEKTRRSVTGMKKKNLEKKPAWLPDLGLGKKGNFLEEKKTPRRPGQRGKRRKKRQHRALPTPKENERKKRGERVGGGEEKKRDPTMMARSLGGGGGEKKRGPRPHGRGERKSHPR